MPELSIGKKNVPGVVNLKAGYSRISIIWCGVRYSAKVL
jgi:hypothetical protein